MFLRLSYYILGEILHHCLNFKLTCFQQMSSAIESSMWFFHIVVSSQRTNQKSCCICFIRTCTLCSLLELYLLTACFRLGSLLGMEICSMSGIFTIHMTLRRPYIQYFINWVQNMNLWNTFFSEFRFMSSMLFYSSWMGYSFSRPFKKPNKDLY